MPIRLLKFLIIKKQPSWAVLKYLTIKNIMIKLKYKRHSSRNYISGLWSN